MRRQVPLIVSCTATFLLLAYSTIVTVAMPVIAADLQSSFGALQWVIDAYTIALAALLIPLGTIGDRIGRRRILIWSLIAFAVASLTCALAPNVVVLTLARLVQGIAAAAMFATTLPLLESSYSGRARHRAFAIWGAVSGLAAAVGNVSGGLLSALGWRAIFAAAIPIALGAAILTAARIPPDQATVRGRLNVHGMILLSTAIGGLVIATLVFADHGMSATALLMLALSAMLGIGFVVHEQRHPATAMIGAVLIHNQVLLVAIVVAAAYYFAAFGPLPAVSSWLQDALGVTPVGTAMVLSVQPVIFFATSALLGPWIGGLQRHVPFAIGLVFCGAGCLGFALPAAVPGWQAILPALLLTGIGSGLISPVLPAAAMQGVAPSQTGASSSVVNAARQLGISLGVAAGATAVRIYQPGHDHTQWSHTLIAMALITASVCAAATAIVLLALRWRGRSAPSRRGARHRCARDRR